MLVNDVLSRVNLLTILVAALDARPLLTVGVETKITLQQTNKHCQVKANETTRNVYLRLYKIIRDIILQQTNKKRLSGYSQRNNLQRLFKITQNYKRL